MGKLTPAALSGESNQQAATPAWFMSQLYDMGHKFDLDVCAERDTACAPMFFDEASDGLQKPWFGNVWCNPPWAKPLPWIEKGLDEIRAGRCISATFLLPAKTDTRWFRALFNVSSVIMLITPRLNYWYRGEGIKNNIAFGSALFIIQSHTVKQPCVIVREFRRPKGADR